LTPALKIEGKTPRILIDFEAAVGTGHSNRVTGLPLSKTPTPKIGWGSLEQVLGKVLVVVFDWSNGAVAT
jgi:hypothetical protein